MSDEELFEIVCIGFNKANHEYIAEQIRIAQLTTELSGEGR